MSLPHQLLSETTGEPFQKCSVCENDLQNQLYFVEKAYHRNLGDNLHMVIFEYAICESCKREMVQHISISSMQKMQNFMWTHQQQVDEFMQQKTDFECCSFSGKPLVDTEEYHIVAVIKNGILQMNPVIFGDQMMQEYQALLSDETKGFFDDFYDKFIDIPPSLAKILRKDIKPVML